MDGTALCSLVNKLAGFLRAPGATVEVASGTGDASTVASRNAGLQRKVRKLLIDCLELLDLTDSTTCELVDTALQHIKDLVALNKLNQNQPADQHPSVRLNRKRKFAIDQWQTLAALVGTYQDDALSLAPADEVGEVGKRTGPKGIKRKDMASVEGGQYQPSAKVRKLPFASENSRSNIQHCFVSGLKRPGQRRQPGHRHLEVLAMPSDHDMHVVLAPSQEGNNTCLSSRARPRGLQEEDGEEVPMGTCRWSPMCA
eukprot:Skav231716  [mRNA]  locus=scaffold2515:19781:20707:+ [translate_table: standard]